MPVYRVNNVGQYGLVDRRDLRPYELPPEAWSRVRNARMHDGAAISVEGYKSIIDIGDPEIHALDYYNGPTTQHKIIYAGPAAGVSDAKIYTVDGASEVREVQKAGLQGDPYPDNIWITDQLNSIPVATNNKDTPQCFYNDGGPIDASTISQDIPDWGPGGTYEGARCRILVAYKSFLVALNINDVNAYPNMVGWSDAADPGLMPASWDYNDATTLANRTVLGAESGAIIAAKVMRDDLLIYCEYATYRMTFIANSPLVMRFTKIYDNVGAFGPRCVGSFGSKHFVVTKDDAVVHDGQQQPVSVADKRVRNRIFETLDEDDVNRVYVAPYLRWSEIWLVAPDSVTKEMNTAVVWGWEEGTWAPRDLPDTRHIASLPFVDPTDEVIVDTWDGGLEATWDGGPDNIWDAGGALGDLRFEGATTEGCLCQIEEETAVADALLEREDINLAADQNLEIALEIYIRAETVEPLTVTLGSSLTMEGPIQWGVPASFNSETDYHVTRRATGRRHALRFQGRNFRLHGYDIVWEPAGHR